MEGILPLSPSYSTPCGKSVGECRKKGEPEEITHLLLLELEIMLQWKVPPIMFAVSKCNRCI